MDEVEMAYALDQVSIHAPIKLSAATWYDENDERLATQDERIIDTTVGRVIFNRILPEELQFVNRVLDKGAIQDLVGDVYRFLHEDGTPEVVDAIKDIGFAYATRSGTTIAISDITVPSSKQDIIETTLEQTEAVRIDYRRGLLTEQEQTERIIDLWQKTTSAVAEAVEESMDPAPAELSPYRSVPVSEMD